MRESSRARRFWRRAPLPRGDGRPQLERRIDLAYRLESAARSAHGDIAVIEDSPEQALVDVDALDFLHVHLDRMAADEAFLENDAAVGHRDFRRHASEPRADEARQR